MLQHLVDRKSNLWDYLLPEQQEIIEDCEKLIEDARLHPKMITDYSYIVFPMAKVYEGFLKKFLLDTGLIYQQQYESDHFRIGKVLNPNLPDHLKIEGLYESICSHLGSSDLADRFWQTWKRGRNLLFHYFPGNLQRITLAEAIETAREIGSTMSFAVTACKLPLNQD